MNTTKKSPLEFGKGRAPVSFPSPSSSTPHFSLEGKEVRCWPGRGNGFSSCIWLPGELPCTYVGSCLEACQGGRLLMRCGALEMSFLTAQLWFGVKWKQFHQLKLRKHREKCLISVICCCVTNHPPVLRLTTAFCCSWSCGLAIWAGLNSAGMAHFCFSWSWLGCLAWG